MLSLPVGSLDGLINLRQGICQISGAHLLAENGEYNLPFVRHLFPDRAIDLVTLAHRTQGLIVAPGNPLGIHSLADLSRAGLRFINRNPGSGTRLWLDTELKRLGLSPGEIEGYQRVAFTHTATARAVAAGQADAALGLQAAAHKFDLGFIPLFNERYDLIFPREFTEPLGILLDYVETSKFRQLLDSMTGYQSASTGGLVSV
jgi:putative molybdopterin biosynthesis protein